jgi:branched-subunit amino acid transport protein
VLWPTDATNGVTILHLGAAFAALFVAYITRKVIWGMLAGLVVFFSPLIITLL